MKTKNRKNRSVKGTSVHLEIKMNSKINGITFKDIKSSKHHSSCCGRPRTVPQRRQDLAKKRPSALDALEWFSRCPLTILHPSMQPGSATIACTGRYSGVKAANHHLETDLRAAPYQHRDQGTAANTRTRCIEGLLMMSIDDPAPTDAAWKRNYCVR